MEPGQTLGLLGRTGSGKTTLARLLVRLYDPASGRILLDGVDTRCMRLAELRTAVGYVTQEVRLFSGTIRDNLTFFDPRIPDERLYEALRSLGLEKWLKKLPDGLDTVLGAGGAGLSAGESQLLAFARLLLQDPGVVVMDEPTSRLDPARERLLTEASRRLLKGRTAIVIAHRLDTVRRLDAIMILANGEIAEFGPQAALAADPGSIYQDHAPAGAHGPFAGSKGRNSVERRSSRRPCDLLPASPRFVHPASAATFQRDAARKHPARRRRGGADRPGPRPRRDVGRRPCAGAGPRHRRRRPGE